MLSQALRRLLRDALELPRSAPISARREAEALRATLEQAALILLSSEPFPFAEKHRAEMIKETGLPAERFRLVDGQLLSWHGARTLEGLDYAERALG